MLPNGLRMKCILDVGETRWILGDAMNFGRRDESRLYKVDGFGKQ